VRPRSSRERWTAAASDEVKKPGTRNIWPGRTVSTTRWRFDVRFGGRGAGGGSAVRDCTDDVASTALVADFLPPTPRRLGAMLGVTCNRVSKR
jgi:hypothetical protein